MSQEKVIRYFLFSKRMGAYASVFHGKWTVAPAGFWSQIGKGFASEAEALEAFRKLDPKTVMARIQEGIATETICKKAGIPVVDILDVSAAGFESRGIEIRSREIPTWKIDQERTGDWSLEDDLDFSPQREKEYYYGV